MERLAGFVHQPRHHQQGRGRIGPPPAERRVRGESEQQGERQVRAGQRLFGFGAQRGAADLGRGTQLAVRHERHEDERRPGEQHSDQTFVRHVPLPQYPPGLNDDVDGQAGERYADEAVHDAVGAFDTV